MRGTITTLRATSFDTAGKQQNDDVMQYCREDMVELFDDAQRAHLAKGFPVIKHSKYGKTIFTDLLAFHTANRK